MEQFLNETRQAVAEGGRSDVDPEMLAHLMTGAAVLWPLSVRIELEDPAARRAATARLTRELKRLLLYGLLRPEQWPQLVREVSREPAPAARRPRRTP